MLPISCKSDLFTSNLDQYSSKNLDDDDDQNYSSSSSIIGRNIDVLIQILVCLPVKSLIIFKSVSKEWHSLISDYYFLTKFSLRKFYFNIPSMIVSTFISGPINPKNFVLINLDQRKVNSDCVNSNCTPFKTLTFCKTIFGLDILQSCNGLFLCYSFPFIRFKCNLVYIFNPSTNQQKLIPNRNYSSADIRLAFDPLKSPYYQVVNVGIIDRWRFQIEIYDSKTNSWRLSGNPFIVATDTFITYCVFCNGCLHWVSLSTNSLLIFDIDRELKKTMLLPPIPEGCSERKIEYFGEYKGLLHLIETYEPCTTWFDVLEMDIDRVGWNLKYRVNLDEFTFGNLGMSFSVLNRYDGRFEFSILLLIEEEKHGWSRLVLQISSNKAIISYDLKEKSFQKIHDFDAAKWCAELSSGPYRFFHSHQYVETLADV